MSALPEQLFYSETHEWVRLEEDGSLTLGITDHAQELLGDMVFVELPEVESQLTQNAECAVVESVKAAADVYSPVAGVVVETNDALNEQPELVNQDPYGAGWLFRMQPDDPAEIERLLNAVDYQQLIDDE